jgi:hypothetical protein
MTVHLKENAPGYSSTVKEHQQQISKLYKGKNHGTN